MRNGRLQDLGFEKGAYGEEFLNIVGGEFRHHGAAIGDDTDEAFGVELPQSFPYWNAADVELSGDDVLTELGAFGDLTTNDHLAQPLGYSGGQRPSRNCRFYGVHKARRG